MLERLVHAGNIRTGFGLTSSAHYRSILRVTYAPIAGRVFKIKGVPEAEDELRLGAGTADSRIGVPVRCLNHLANVHWSTTSWRMCLKRSTPRTARVNFKLPLQPPPGNGNPVGKAAAKPRGSHRTAMNIATPARPNTEGCEPGHPIRKMP